MVKNLNIGTVITMEDEQWIVVKPGARGQVVSMRPHNTTAKSRYISLAIDFNISELKF